MKTIKKLLPILFLGLILMSTSCLKDNDTVPNVPTAALRMVNAYSYAQSIVFTENNNYLTAPSIPLKYNEYTTNLALIFPGNKSIRVYDDLNKLVSDTTITLKDSTYYTSFVFGNTEKAKNLITTDVSLTDLGAKSALRFLHLASNLGNVNLYIDDITTPLYENRIPELLSENTNLSHTTFKAENSGKRKITITDINNNKLVEREHDFKQNRYYSIILTGDKNNTSKPLYIGIIQQ